MDGESIQPDGQPRLIQISRISRHHQTRDFVITGYRGGHGSVLRVRLAELKEKECRIKHRSNSMGR
jgi:hypothetical protein